MTRGVPVMKDASSGRQEQYAVGDLPRVAYTLLERAFRRQLVVLLDAGPDEIAVALGGGRLDAAGADAVDPDVVRGQVEGEASGKL